MLAGSEALGPPAGRTSSRRWPSASRVHPRARASARWAPSTERLAPSFLKGAVLADVGVGASSLYRCPQAEAAGEAGLHDLGVVPVPAIGGWDAACPPGSGSRQALAGSRARSYSVRIAVSNRRPWRMLISAAAGASRAMSDRRQTPALTIGVANLWRSWRASRGRCRPG